MGRPKAKNSGASSKGKKPPQNPPNSGKSYPFRKGRKRYLDEMGVEEDKAADAAQSDSEGKFVKKASHFLHPVLYLNCLLKPCEMFNFIHGHILGPLYINGNYVSQLWSCWVLSECFVRDGVSKNGRGYSDVYILSFVHHNFSFVALQFEVLL